MSLDLGRFQAFGCDEVKHPRVVQISTNCLHRLITNNAILTSSVQQTLEILSRLIDAGLEELKVLQCILALVTNPLALKGELLCKGISLCLKLKGNKDATTAAIATATLRQIVAAIFERVEVEDRQAELSQLAHQAARRHSHAPANLRQSASDAYLLFQDLCMLTNGDLPFWLTGNHDITQTFGLELIETALTGSPSLFFKHPEFSFLLKEKVCALVIRLFSPSIKHAEQTQKAKGLLFPVMIRLLRITSTLIRLFRKILSTECEMFDLVVSRLFAPARVHWSPVPFSWCHAWRAPALGGCGAPVVTGAYWMLTGPSNRMHCLTIATISSSGARSSCRCSSGFSSPTSQYGSASRRSR